MRMDRMDMNRDAGTVRARALARRAHQNPSQPSSRTDASTIHCGSISFVKRFDTYVWDLVLHTVLHSFMRCCEIILNWLRWRHFEIILNWSTLRNIVTMCCAHCIHALRLMEKGIEKNANVRKACRWINHLNHAWFIDWSGGFSKEKHNKTHYEFCRLDCELCNIAIFTKCSEFHILLNSIAGYLLMRAPGEDDETLRRRHVMMVLRQSVRVSVTGESFRQKEDEFGAKQPRFLLWMQMILETKKRLKTK